MGSKNTKFSIPEWFQLENYLSLRKFNSNQWVSQLIARVFLFDQNNTDGPTISGYEARQSTRDNIYEGIKLNPLEPYSLVKHLDPISKLNYSPNTNSDNDKSEYSQLFRQSVSALTIWQRLLFGK